MEPERLDALTREWFETFGRLQASRLGGAWTRVTRGGAVPSEPTLDVVAEFVTEALLDGLRQVDPEPPPALEPLLRGFVAGLLEEAAGCQAREREWLQFRLN